jgi:hypothetical protein
MVGLVTNSERRWVCLALSLVALVGSSCSDDSPASLLGTGQSALAVTYQDLFDDTSRGAEWSAYGTTVEDGAHLVANTTTPTSSMTETYMVLGRSTTHRWYFRHANGVVHARRRINGVDVNSTNITYSAASHKLFRLFYNASTREVIFYQPRATDGTWTEWLRVSDDGQDLSGTWLELGCGKPSSPYSGYTRATANLDVRNKYVEFELAAAAGGATDGRCRFNQVRVFDDNKPSAPTGLTVTAGNAQVSLSWNANPASDNVVRYQVYRNNQLIADGPTSPSHVDTGLTNGTTYSYRVSAWNGSVYGDWTDPALNATPTGSTPPPTGALPIFSTNSVLNLSCQVSGSAAGSGCTNVTDPAGSGQSVMRLRAVEQDASGGVVRAQAVTSALLDINGQEYWDVTGVYFPSNFPTVQTWQAVYSYYGPPYSGSPPNIQGVHGNTIEYDLFYNNTRIWSRTLSKGVWLNFARRYKLSTSASVGWMEIYYSTGNDPLQLQTLANGQTRWVGATVSSAHSGGTNDFRISNYRGAGQTGFGDVSIYYRRVSLWRGTATLGDINAHYFK